MILHRRESIGCIGAIATSLCLSLPAADMAHTNAAPGQVLLLDNLGRVVAVPTNILPQTLQPPSAERITRQVPIPVAGSSQPAAIQQRLREEGAGQKRLLFFPPYPPFLMPYLASEDEYGNTAIRPGALFPFAPFEPWVQNGKYRLSDYGFRYSLQQTLTFVNLSSVKQGGRNLAFYTLDLKSKWAVFVTPTNTTAGWISSQIQAKSGLGTGANNQDAQSNLGTVTDPTSIWSGVNGFRVPELAWQESMNNGRYVAVAGMVSQRNYLDDNAYANSGRSKFMNSALVNSQVLPLAQYNLGFNLQCQPMDDWYAMLGGSAGNAPAGTVPWADFTWQNWSLPLEIGYAPDDLLKLGPGVYRAQPYVAGKSGNTGTGICFDAQQKLGAQTPFGWFGRFGFSDSKVAPDADKQIGTGFVMQGPFQHLLVGHPSNDFLGTGFVWSQPSSGRKTVYHKNEYVWETVYVCQITPFIKLEPDVQVVWDPAYNRDTNDAVVFQLQVAIAW